MSRLLLRGVRAGGLQVAELTLGAGLFPILARPDDGAALVAALGGQRRDRAGVLSIDGADPQRSPVARARIALLLAEEPASEARSVGGALTTSLGSSAAATSALNGLGIGTWSARDPRRLTPAERRSVALAAALAANDPLLVALHEPLADVPGVNRGCVLERIRALVERGATVVPVTASVRQLLEFGGEPHVLALGTAFRAAGPLGAVSAGRDVELVASSPAARSLATLLLGRPEVEAVFYDEVTAPRQFRLRARDVRSGCLAILAVAADTGAHLTALHLEPPSLDSVEAASMNAARASLRAPPTTAPFPPAVPAGPLALGGVSTAAPAAAPAPLDPWTVAMPFGVPPPPPPPPPGEPPPSIGAATATDPAAITIGSAARAPDEA